MRRVGSVGIHHFYIFVGMRDMAVREDLRGMDSSGI